MCPDYQTIQLFIHVADTAMLFCHLQKFRLFGDMSQAGIIHVKPRAQHSIKFSCVGLRVCNCVVLSSWLRNSFYFFLTAHMLCLQQHGAAPLSPTLNELLLSSFSFSLHLSVTLSLCLCILFEQVGPSFCLNLSVWGLFPFIYSRAFHTWNR